MVWILLVLVVLQFWFILGLGSLHVFSLLNKQKVQITNEIVILLSLIYGPFTYSIMFKFYKD